MQNRINALNTLWFRTVLHWVSYSTSLCIILPTFQITLLELISTTDYFRCSYFRYNFFLLHQVGVTQWSPVNKSMFNPEHLSHVVLLKCFLFSLTLKEENMCPQTENQICLQVSIPPALWILVFQNLKKAVHVHCCSLPICCTFQDLKSCTSFLSEDHCFSAC